MIRETHQRFIIEPEDKMLAEKYNFNNKVTTMRGMLGEIALCKYLGIEYKNPGYDAVDVTDSFGTRYQVKTTTGGKLCYSHWIEQQKDPTKFDYYAICVVDPDETRITIEAIMPSFTAHALKEVHPKRRDLFRIKRK